MKTPLARTVFVFAMLSVCAYAFMSLRGPNGVQALFEKRQQSSIKHRRLKYLLLFALQRLERRYAIGRA